MASFNFPPAGGGSQSWKDAVANAGALPPGGSDCEVRMVCDTKTLYAWDQGGGSWGPITAPVAGVLTANRAVITNASGQLTTGAVTDTEIGYVGGVTSSIQTQLNGKQATITGAATTITSANLTIDRALISSGAGKVAVSAVTATEIGYVGGVTSSIQTQLNTKITDPMTTRGDIVIRNASNVTDRLALGNAGEILTSSGADIVYAVNKGLITLSTSLLSGCEITINADPSKINVAAGLGIHVDNTTNPGTPDATAVPVAEQLGVVLTDLGTQAFTALSIDISGNIIQRSAGATPTERRDTFTIGTAVHADMATVTQTVGTHVPAYDTAAQLNDLMQAIGFFSTSGNDVSGVTSTLSIQKAIGGGFSPGINVELNRKDPNNTPMPALSPVTAFFVDQLGVVSGSGDFLDPTTYDNAGVSTAVPGNNNATIQYIYLFATNQIAILAGQEVFSTFSAAVDAAGNETVIVPDIVSGGILVSRIVMRKTTTDTTNTSDARFIPTGAVSSGGSGGSPTTMTQSYNVSVQPQITFTAGLGGVEYRDAATPIGAFLFRIADNAGTTSFLNADVNGVTGSELFSTGLTASRALASDGSKKLVSSATTATELGYVSGVTSAIQTQINNQLVVNQQVAVAGDVTLTNKGLHNVNTTVARSLAMPAAATSVYLVIKDITGSAQTNPITVTTPGAETIDGEATLVIDANYASVTLYSDGSNYFVL